MDARQRINNARRSNKRGKRPGRQAGAGTIGGRAAAGQANGNSPNRSNIRQTGRPGITKAKNIKRNIIQKGGPQIDPKRFSAGTIVQNGGGKDLRNVLQQKQEDKERKKSLPPKLQSRLGLQSQAAREEAQKELIKQKKQTKPTANTPNVNIVRDCG